MILHVFMLGLIVPFHEILFMKEPVFSAGSFFYCPEAASAQRLAGMEICRCIQQLPLKNEITLGRTSLTRNSQGLFLKVLCIKHPGYLRILQISLFPISPADLVPFHINNRLAIFPKAG